MYVDRGGGLWKYRIQINNKIFEDSINPKCGVYIVLFVLRLIRGPPKVFSILHQKKKGEHL